MKTYQVTVIKPGRERDYFDFWIKGIHVNAQGTILDSGSLCNSVTVQANSKAEAREKIREDYPGHTLDDNLHLLG